MTLLTISNLYAEDFSLHDIAVNRTWQLVGTKMTKAAWGGDLVFEDPGGRKLRGNQNFHLEAEGTNLSRHYGNLFAISFQISKSTPQTFAIVFPF